jgi:hypothetical protein
MVALCPPYITLTRSFWTAESPGTNTCLRPACSDIRPAVCLRSAWLLHLNTPCLCRPVCRCDKGVRYWLGSSNLIGKYHWLTCGLQRSENYILDLQCASALRAVRSVADCYVVWWGCIASIGYLPPGRHAYEDELEGLRKTTKCFFQCYCRSAWYCNPITFQYLPDELNLC